MSGDFPSSGRIRVAAGYFRYMLNVGVDFSFECEVADMNFGGCLVNVRKVIPDPVREGANVELEITSGQFIAPVKIPSRIECVFEERPSILLAELRFTDPEGLSERLPPNLQKLINRRQAFRVQPAASETIEVQIQVVAPSRGAAPSRGWLVDLSNTGIAISLDRATDSTFGAAHVSEVTLTFSLRELRSPIIMRAHVRNRVAHGAMWKWGFDFDAKTTPDFARQQMSLAPYLMRSHAAKLSRKR